MLRLIGTIVGIVLFCWAAVSAFSIFSELKFLVDGWTWSVDQVPISIKSIALAVGKYVSGIVGGYREFVHGLVHLLHVPTLPQFVYDVLGVVAFSVGRGLRVLRKARAGIAEHFRRFTHVAEPTIPNFNSMSDMQQIRALVEWARDKPQYYRRSDFPLNAFCDSVTTHATRYFYPEHRPTAFESFLVNAIYFVTPITIYGSAVGIPLAILFGIDFLYRHFA